MLDDFVGEFSDYKPIFHTSLPKASIIGQVDAIGIIKKELETEIGKFKSLNAFLVWESIVNESSGKLTNAIATLYEPDDDWDKKTQYLLYKLALAYSGKAVEKFSDIQQLKNALYTLSLTFADNIESSIDSVIDSGYSGLINKTAQNIESLTPIINKLLLISENVDSSKQPGNLFFCMTSLKNDLLKVEEDYKKGKESINNLNEGKKEEALKNHETKRNKSKQSLEKSIKDLESVYNDIAVSALIDKKSVNKSDMLKEMIGIELNITPLCDYAQEKAKLFRILPGVLIPQKFRDELSTHPAFIYVSDANFKILEADYLFLFDFRYLHSISEAQIRLRTSSIRLKQQFLSDIQVKLSSHINRAGVLFLSQK